MTTYAEHAAGWNYPGKWAAVAIPPFLGNKWTYAVRLNNHTDVGYFATLAEAELDAAKRNYAHGSYAFPRSLEPTEQH